MATTKRATKTRPPAKKTARAPKNWSETPWPGWAATVERWHWKKIDTLTWRKTGTCPRCRHRMSVQVEVALVPGVNVPVDIAYYNQPDGTAGAEVRIAVDIPQHTLAYCNACPQPHEGHPEDGLLAHGCGQWAQIKGPEWP